MSANPRFHLQDARWLAHRFVESTGAFRFIHVEREDHRGVPFLTDDYLGQRTINADIALAECAEIPAHPIAFLFHSAFCGSTMLTRALDLPGTVMGLSEPVVLNDVVGFRRRGGPQERVAEALDIALRLLARPFAPNELTVVKPSNIVNSLAGPMLALRPDAPAVFLYAPLETFLISVARKGLGCRLWVRELLEGQLRDGYADLGFTSSDYFRQTDLQIAAIGWLAQHKAFARLAERVGGTRLRAINADQLAADPESIIRATANHFGLNASEDAMARMLNGPALGRHSKSGVTYSGEQRNADYANARAAYGEEIEKVLIWAEAVAQSAGISLDAPMRALS